MPDGSGGTCQPEAFLYPLRAAEELVDLRDRGALVDGYDLTRAEGLLTDLVPLDETDYPHAGQ